MKKTKSYPWTKFPAELIQRALDEVNKVLPDPGVDPFLKILSVSRDSESWDYTEFTDFFSDYRSDFTWAMLKLHYQGGVGLEISASIDQSVPVTNVSVASSDRGEIESVFGLFEDALQASRIPKPKKPREPPWEKKVRVFVGHGRSEQWRDLKDYLSEQYGLTVVAYEVGTRGGRGVREILEEMLTQSSFAVLVLTGETEDVEGRLHARDNVIHELGLFQGRLGFNRAIVLLEQAVSEFSNIEGIHQVRYSKGRIRETFGDVVAVIKREFAAAEE